jgi:glycosyltransferase involved in cell wall biosynthesis
VKTTVSIITPSYNQGEYIEETIKSVISQEGDFFIDYIIMDGGSTDDTVGIIKKYDALLKEGVFPTKCKGITYRWTSERDKGQVDAIKKGFAIATGDIGGWLNSDDIYHDTKVFERVLGEFNTDDSLMILTGDGPFIDKEGREFGLHHVDRLNLAELIYLDYHILQPATFLKKAVYKEEGLDESFNYCFDAEFFIRLIGKGYKYRKINDSLACFRFYPETKTLSGLGKRYKESLKISRMYGKNIYFYAVSAIYKYFEIVLQNKYPATDFIKKATEAFRALSYKVVTGRPTR